MTESVAVRLSVIVITLDEAAAIEACLRSCSFADQIVVVDSGSTDATPELARACGAEVHLRPDWPGFGLQKGRALALARGDWVLSIDADEQLDDALQQAVRQVLADDAAGRPVCDGYWLRRASRFRGRVIRFGDWRNDQVLRLFRRDRSRFSEDLVHEKVLIEGRVGRLAGMLLHDSVEDYADGRDKMLRYARLGARKLRARGRGGLLSAIGHASWTLLRGLVVRLGFLDGVRGWQIAWLNTQGTFLRYRWAAGEPGPSSGSQGDLP